jgi:hypothetical protein
MKTTTKPGMRKHRTPPAQFMQIEMPPLSDEAAAAVANVLVQLYHQFEAAYYGQILNHHADAAAKSCLQAPPLAPRHRPAEGELF